MDVVLLEQGALMQRMLKGDFESIMFFFSSTNLDPAMNPDFWLSSGSAHVWNIGQPTPATDWEKEIDDLMRDGDGAASIRPSASGCSTRCRGSSPRTCRCCISWRRGSTWASQPRSAASTPAILRPQLLWNVERMTVQPARR